MTILSILLESPPSEKVSCQIGIPFTVCPVYVELSPAFQDIVKKCT